MAIVAKKAPEEKKPETLVLERPDLDEYTGADRSFRAAFLRYLASIAAADGIVNIAEYDQFSAAAVASGFSAGAVHAALHYLERPTDLKVALAELRRVGAAESDPIRRRAFKDAQAMLSLQGGNSLKFAQDLGEALSLSLSLSELAGFQSGAAPSMWKSVARQSTRLVRGGKILPLATECVRLTGDERVARMVTTCLDGQAEMQSLQDCVGEVLNVLGGHIESFEQRLQTFQTDESAGAQHIEHVELIVKQVGQRLAMMAARIEDEKAEFDEDFEELIHDAGNAVELEMADRLKTDDWKSARVWSSMAKTTLGKELERRLNRTARRHEKRLGHMKEDLRAFKEDFSLVRASVFQRQHHSKLSLLMPTLQTSTRIKNAAESAAGMTIFGGVIASLGTGAAFAAFGSVAVLPVIAPVAPFVAGAFVVASLAKWMMNSKDRKDDELRHKREAFQQGLRTHLAEIRSSYFAQLDTLGVEYRDTANALIRPMVLEAEAIRRLPDLEKRMAMRVLSDTRRALASLNTTFPKIA
jgi:hypothetical protein